LLLNPKWKKGYFNNGKRSFTLLGNRFNLAGSMAGEEEMKIETVQMVKDLIYSGRGWSLNDIKMALIIHEGMPNNWDTRQKASQLEQLIVRFKNARAESYFEQMNYHRWQRMNNLITQKVVNGLAVTQAEKIHCCRALLKAEMFVYEEVSCQELKS
jgi:hypothetical protein